MSLLKKGFCRDKLGKNPIRIRVLSECTANLTVGVLSSRRRQIPIPVFSKPTQDQPLLRPPIDNVLIALVPEAHCALAHIRRTISHFPRPAPDSRGVLFELQLETSFTHHARQVVGQSAASRRSASCFFSCPLPGPAVDQATRRETALGICACAPWYWYPEWPCA